MNGIDELKNKATVRTW